jgi:hypothetical protein
VNTSIPSLTLKSTVLALFAIMMSALALLDRPTDSASNTDAKVIAQLNPDHVQRIELSSATAKTILEKSELTGDWEITAPFTQDADSRRVSNLLAAFRSSVLADVTVDAGNLSEYGLDASNGLVVELWANDEAPVASFTIGKDLAGGSSFVRVSVSAAHPPTGATAWSSIEKKPTFRDSESSPGMGS